MRATGDTEDYERSWKRARRGVPDKITRAR